jgi:hypothetical protein
MTTLTIGAMLTFSILTSPSVFAGSENPLYGEKLMNDDKKTSPVPIEIDQTGIIDVFLIIPAAREFRVNLSASAIQEYGYRFSIKGQEVKKSISNLFLEYDIDKDINPSPSFDPRVAIKYINNKGIEDILLFEREYISDKTIKGIVGNERVLVSKSFIQNLYRLVAKFGVPDNCNDSNCQKFVSDQTL